MEKATDSRTCSPALGTSAESEPRDVPTSPLVLVVDAYPDNPVVKYLVTPFAKHLFKTILALLVFLFGSLKVCGYWNSEEVCDRRFYTTLFMAAGIISLMGNSYYLRQKLAKQQ